MSIEQLRDNEKKYIRTVLDSLSHERVDNATSLGVLNYITTSDTPLAGAMFRAGKSFLRGSFWSKPAKPVTPEQSLLRQITQKGGKDYNSRNFILLWEVLKSPGLAPKKDNNGKSTLHLLDSQFPGASDGEIRGRIRDRAPDILAYAIEYLNSKNPIKNQHDTKSEVTASSYSSVSSFSSQS